MKYDICLVCSRLMVKELDPWFQTRTSQLDETVKRLTQIKKTLSVMSSYKVHYIFFFILSFYPSLADLDTLPPYPSKRRT